jgi:hypothetical protein
VLVCQPGDSSTSCVPSSGGVNLTPNVGIGSANPGQTLDVNGTVRATNFIGSLTGTASGNLTSNQNITISGDISGSGATAITATLPTINTNVGTYQGITVNGKGQITGASNQSYLTGNQTITASGDATGSGTTTLPLTFATVNSNIGSFTNANVTVNAKGLVTAVSNGATAPTPGGISTSLQQNLSGSFAGTNVYQSTGGNVGIGTTNPGQTLDVNGTVRIGASNANNSLIVDSGTSSPVTIGGYKYTPDSNMLYGVRANTFYGIADGYPFLSYGDAAGGGGVDIGDIESKYGQETFAISGSNNPMAFTSNAYGMTFNAYSSSITMNTQGFTIGPGQAFYVDSTTGEIIGQNNTLDSQTGQAIFGILGTANYQVTIQDESGSGFDIGDYLGSWTIDSAGNLVGNTAALGTSNATDILTVNSVVQGQGITSNYLSNGGCDSNALALFHFDGTNGSTTAVDSNCNGSGAITGTFYGTSALSTSNKKFGTASLLVQGGATEDFYIPWSYSAFGTNNFTIDFQIKFNSTSTQYITGMPSGSTNPAWTFFYNGSSLEFYNYNSGYTIDFSTPFTIDTTSWHWIGVERISNTNTSADWGVMVDGTLKTGASLTLLNGSWNGSVNTNTGVIWVGGMGAYTSSSAQAYIDEYRISNVARWSGNVPVQILSYGVPGSGWPDYNFAVANSQTGKIFTDGSNAGAMSFAVPTTTKMVITTTGNVGIGSVNPGQALDVTGTVRAIGFTLTGNGAQNTYVLTATDSAGDAKWQASSGGVGGLNIIYDMRYQ